MYILRTFCGDYTHDRARSQGFTARSAEDRPGHRRKAPAGDYAVQVTRKVQSTWQLLQVPQTVSPVTATPAATSRSSGTSSCRSVSLWSAILLSLIFIASTPLDGMVQAGTAHRPSKTGPARPVVTRANHEPFRRGFDLLLGRAHPSPGLASRGGPGGHELARPLRPGQRRRARALVAFVTSVTPPMVAASAACSSF